MYGVYGNLLTFSSLNQNSILVPPTGLEINPIGQPNSSYLREKVYSHYKLGYGNAKVLIKRLSSVGITKEEVKEYIKEIKDENCK